MSGYKLMYNTPDDGKGSLGLMKNYAFNNSMCDGIYLQQKVPPSTTETELFICQGSAKLDSAGTILASAPFMCMYVTNPVDEYITVVINLTFKNIWGSGETIKSSKVLILPPQQTLICPEMFAWTAYHTFNDVYIYVGKRLAYKFEGDTECKNFKDTYFGARKVTGDTTENTHKGFPLTCNNESLYVYPLCKDFKIENDDDNEISSIHLPAFRYKDEIYYPTIKISLDNEKGALNKENILNKVVGYVPSFIGDTIKEKYNLKDENIAAENTGDLGAGTGLEFNPDDFDFTPPEFVGGLDLSTADWVGTVVNEVVKESSSTAVKDTTLVESTPVVDTSGGTGDSGSSGELDYIITGGTMVKYDVKSGPVGTASQMIKTFKGDVPGAKIRHFSIYDADNNYVGSVVQLVNTDGNVEETYNTSFNPLSGGTFYLNEETGEFTYVTNKGDIYISNGQGGTDYLEFSGGTNNLGHDVYYGPDGFPVYIWTDPDTGEKIIM